MNINNKNEEAYRTIGEITKELNLVDKKTGNLQTHTIRYWETQFKQIRPIIKAGKRRYYSVKNFETIKYIKFLLKERGLTINGAKKILNKNETDSLDGNNFIGINKRNLDITKSVKGKIKNISKIIKELKNFK